MIIQKSQIRFTVPGSCQTYQQQVYLRIYTFIKTNKINIIQKIINLVILKNINLTWELPKVTSSKGIHILPFCYYTPSQF